MKLLNAYAKKANIDVVAEKINEKDGYRLFSLIVTDYQHGKLDLDTLSALCEAMYAKFESTSDEMYSLLLGGAEIEWYIRWQPEKGTGFIQELIQKFGVLSEDK